MTFNPNARGNNRIQPGSLCYIRNMPKEWEVPHARLTNGAIVTAVEFIRSYKAVNANNGRQHLFPDCWKVKGTARETGDWHAWLRAKWLIPINDPSSELDIFREDQKTAAKEKEAERMLENFNRAFPGIADAVGKLRVLIIRPVK